MNGILAVITLVFLPMFLIRWSRWLAIVQQKEYRIDRLWSFVRSSEGASDLLRLLPRKSDFSRSGLKRPAKTARIAMVATCSVFVFGVASFIAYLFFGFFGAFVATVFIYMLMPGVLAVALLPSSFLSAFFVKRTLARAQKILEKDRPIIIGIGGSYGKTSTKHLLAHVLSQKYSVFTTPKSHNTKYSIAQSILAGYRGQHIAIIEYGAYTIGEIAFLTSWFPPNLVIETGFTSQHFQLFGSLENSIQAESELVAALPLGGKVYVNAADPGAQKISEVGAEKSRAKLVPYSGPNSLVCVDEVQLTENGHLLFVWHGRRIHSQLLGRHYLPNLQAAIAVAQDLDVFDEEIISALKNFVPNDSFVRSFRLENGALCIDDGETSNPRGFTAAIELVRELRAEQKILITPGIVDLGSESAPVHTDLAQKSAQVFNQVWYVGSSGKEEFQGIFTEMLSDQESILARIQTLNNRSLVLIEGRMPLWLNAALRKKAHETNL